MLPPTLKTVIAATLASSSLAKANEVKAWEEEIKTCSHVTNLEQQLNSGPVLQESSKCHACKLSSNLWLCLCCGSLGCGRAQYGGIGGNGHVLQHYQSTGHAVNVKLGTITAEGSADLYFYQCDDAQTDEKLQFHLAHFGIEIAKQEKTEKRMTQLLNHQQVKHNMKFDFLLSDKDRNQLIPVCGPGLTGSRCDQSEMKACATVLGLSEDIKGQLLDLGILEVLIPLTNSVSVKVQGNSAAAIGNLSSKGKEVF
ncbi:hypothetical protein PPACK8108_LOCUS13258 [Phakopsora pachyrhizi]|uniref:UBP-type domain-containing protein n=1 Tax=Phakopsora pachyrhizi TaxID=170000 RepID=A0AAV0B5I5_PHAPC|nr:hypothetical protein PPACK8108_LOCUS13258 [Phakopsora pachyrhizi]